MFLPLLEWIDISKLGVPPYSPTLLMHSDLMYGSLTRTWVLGPEYLLSTQKQTKHEAQPH